MLKRVFPCLLLAVAASGRNSAAQQNAQPKTAGEAFKNVQVFKDLSEDKFWATMSFFADSLGVSCEHCHETPFDADTARKRKARQMVAMVADLNGHYFKGETVVTCNSCHRGATKPEARPSLDPSHWMKFGEKADALPDGAELIARFRKLTGMAANPVQRGERVSYEMTEYLSEAAPARTHTELLIGGADRFRMTTHSDHDTREWIRNGDGGWMDNSKGWKAMDGGQLNDASGEASAFEWETLKTITDAKTVKTDIARGRKALVVEAKDKDERVWLYFDAQSGMLLRRRMFFDTPYGDASWDVEFDDYRKAGPVTLPYLVQILNPSGNGLTIRKVKERALVERPDAKLFEKPADAK